MLPGSLIHVLYIYERGMLEARAIGRQETQSFPVSGYISGREILIAADSPFHDMLLFQVYQCEAENSTAYDRPIE